MNIIYRIKYPKIFKKDVNVKELDIEEKSVYIYRIFEEQLDYRIIFDIIDSFPKNVQSNLARNIILNCSSYNNYIEFGNKLICKYFEERDLKEFIFQYNVLPFTWFANVAFEILCDKLSKEEIEFLLRVPFNKNSHQQLKIDLSELLFA